MKRIEFIRFAPTLAMMLAACTQEIPETPAAPVPEPEMAKLSISASMESAPGTKTVLDPADYSVSWSVGDKVKFIYELDKIPGEAVSAPLAAGSISGVSATFSATIPAAFASTEAEYKAGGGTSLHLYSVYPSSLETDYSNASDFYVTVPDVQDGSFENADIMLAKWDKTAPASTFYYQALCGLLKIQVEDNAVRKIVISGNADIAGKVSVTFKAGTGGPAVKAVADGRNSVTLNVSGAGTYYAAVLPASIGNLYVSLYNSSGKLIGDKAASGVLVLDRKEICGLGVIATGFSGRYFVKEGGTGDGSSWDNAAGYSGLVAKIKGNDTAVILMATGVYSATEQAAMGTDNTSANYTILGGFPANATGYSEAGRDISENETIIDAGGANRIWILQRGNWVIDGITFRNATRAGSDTGSALVIEGNASSHFKVRNCTFTMNSNTGTVGGGAVRVSGSTVYMNGCLFTENNSEKAGGALFVNTTGKLYADHCTFKSNVSSSYGGAVAVNGGKFFATDCDFDSNTAAVSAGAIYTNGSAEAKFDLCTFRSNVANGTANSNGGGAAWATETSKLYFNRCFMANNMDQYNAHAIYSGANTYIGLNNCVVRGPWGVTKNQGSLLQIKGSNVIVNSTIYCQTGSWGAVSLGSKETNGCRIINSIVINKSSSQYSFYSTSYFMQVYNTIYSVAKCTKTDGTGSHTFTDCLGGASCRSDGNFPVTGGVWDNNGTRFNLDGNRYIYYYPWDGTTDAGNVVNNSISGIKNLISGTANVGSDFLSWLESDELKVGGTEALAVDIRGAARKTSAMWPGSYEGQAATAAIQNFIVRK